MSTAHSSHARETLIEVCGAILLQLTRETEVQSILNDIITCHLPRRVFITAVLLNLQEQLFMALRKAQALTLCTETKVIKGYCWKKIDSTILLLMNLESQYQTLINGAMHVAVYFLNTEG